MENTNNLAFIKCAAIQNLNKVEGFNPLDYVTASKNERGEEYVNLDTKFRQLWFRLCYPNGKIMKKILRLTDQVAAVEARVYLDRNDPEDNYIASGVAQRFYDPNRDFGLYYLESAETIAEGRALGKAGFGIQFCDFDGQRDDVQPDTGVRLQNANSVTGKPADKTKQASSARPDNAAKTPERPTETSKVSSDAKPTGAPAANKPDTPANNAPSECDNTAKQRALENDTLDNAQGAADTDPKNERQTATEMSAPAADTQTGQTDAHYASDTPVEDILKVMTVDEAEKIVINVGFNKGKTLRQVSLANFRQLRWFFESYNGDNNILKAGAKLLYNLSQQQKVS